MGYASTEIDLAKDPLALAIFIVVVAALLCLILLYVKPMAADNEKRYAAETAQWQQTGSYPPVVKRHYFKSSTFTSDLQRMTSLGYVADKAAPTYRYGTYVTWVRPV